MNELDRAGLNENEKNGNESENQNKEKAEKGIEQITNQATEAVTGLVSGGEKILRQIVESNGTKADAEVLSSLEEVEGEAKKALGDLLEGIGEKLEEQETSEEEKKFKELIKEMGDFFIGMREKGVNLNDEESLENMSDSDIEFIQEKVSEFHEYNENSSMSFGDILSTVEFLKESGFPYQLVENVMIKINQTAEIDLDIDDFNKLLKLQSNKDLLSKEDFNSLLVSIIKRQPEKIIPQLDVKNGVEMGVDVVDSLIRSNKLDLLVENIDKFNGVSDQYVADRMIDEGHVDFLFANLDKMPGIEIGQKMADTLILHKEGVNLINNLEKFTGVDRNKLFIDLIHHNYGREAMEKIDKFPDVVLDQKMADLMVSTNRADLVLENIEKFSDVILDQTMADKVMSIYRADLVVKNFDKFEGIDIFSPRLQEQAFQEFDRGVLMGDFDFAIKVSSNFKLGLVNDKNLLNEKGLDFFMKEDRVHLIIENKDKFANIVFDQKMAERLFSVNKADLVVENIDQFKGVDVHLPELQTAAFNKFVDIISGGDFDSATAINDRFELGLEKMFDVFVSVINSPSDEIRRMKEVLIKELKKTENPEKLFASIEQVFVHNNLPEIGKRFAVFEILYPSDRIDEMLKERSYLSPDLKKASKSLRRYHFYRDAIKTSFDSNDRSLRSYIEAFGGENGDIIRKAENVGVDKLTAEESRLLKNTCRKLEVLYEKSQLGQSSNKKESVSVDSIDVNDVIASLRKDLRVPDGKSVVDRVAEMYLAPIGINSVEQALERMKQTSEEANGRTREFASEIMQDNFVFKKGDLLKGIDSDVLAKVLNSGMLAREFMGATADSDATPFDTDFDGISSPNTESARANIESSIASGYGDITILVRDRGQFIRTDLGEKSPEINRQTRGDRRYELFATKQLGLDHMGVRTGLGSMEIDGLFLADNAKEKLPAIAMDIVVGGRYIPVLDRDGELLFTPEKFDEMREKFIAGTPESGVLFDVVDDLVVVSEEHKRAIKEREKVVESNLESNLRVSDRIQQEINEVLAEVGIDLVDPLHESLAGADVSESGSGSRGTNVPGAFDVDFLVTMNSRDLESKDKIHNLLVERFTKLGGKPHEGNRVEQLRMLNVQFPGFNEPVDIDIGLVAKNGFGVYESHDAVSDRLNSIKETSGTEKYKQVIANIVEAKSVLKAAKAYKKGDYGEGGLGGIGVENFILASGGNMIKAFEDFTKSAFDTSGELKNFYEFKKDYVLMDPGINAKTNRHDNFVDNMNADGYSKMAFAVRDYLQKNTTQDRLS